MREPMDKQFNQVVLTCCRLYCDDRYDVDASGVLAPQTYGELCDYINVRTRTMVDGRHSEHTVYGDPEVNYAFRAWHDWTHYRLGQPFTRAGEIVVCRAQQNLVLYRYGAGIIAEHACAVLWAEIVGQRLYEDRWGAFPENQRAFVEGFLISPQRAIGRPPSDYAARPDWATDAEAHAWVGDDGRAPAAMPWTPTYDLDRG